MVEQRFGTKPLISIDGARLTAPFDDQIGTVIVDQDLTAPTVCEVTVTDPERTLLDQTGIALGKSLTADASAVAGEDPKPIFKGTIQSVDVTFGEDGQSVVVVALDDSYRLTQRRLSRSYNDVTISDVVADLCDQVGVGVGKVELDAVVFPHIGLFDESPWDFISRHALDSGCVIRFDDDKLAVVRPSDAATGPDPGDHGAKEPTQLVPGHNLTHLRAHSTTARQVAEVEVRGWDPATKEAPSVTKPAATKVNASDSDPAEVGRQFGTALLVEARPTFQSQARCDHHAEAVSSWLSSQHRQADGEAIGDPALVAGVTISLGAVGPLSGKYLLTHARHRFDNDGYATEFRCSGIHDQSFLSLVGDRPRRRLDGTYPAVVTDIVDPDELGRVRLRFPWLSEEYESSWARNCQVGAGAGRGLLWYPEIGDEVAVTFLDGDPDTPVVTGGLYNGVDGAPFTPYVDSSSGKVLVRGMKTSAGHTLEFVDDAGKEAVRLQSADGKITVLLDQANGKASISGADVTVKATGDLTLEGGGNVNIKGTKINLN